MFQICHALTDLGGHFTEMDEAFCQLVQLTPAELCRRDILSITHHADRAGNEVSLHRLIGQGTSFWIRKRYERDDKTLVWVLNHVSRTIGITGIARIAATSFILPPDAWNGRSNGAAPEWLAMQTAMLKKL